MEEANCSIPARLAAGCADLRAPKYSSPNTVVETKSSLAGKGCGVGSCFEKRAITTLVSRRTLPAIWINRFAVFLDGFRHGVKVRLGNESLEAQEVAAGGARGGGELARKVQDLALLRSIQPVHLLDDFVFKRLGHSDLNLAKSIFKIKKQHWLLDPVVKLRRARPPPPASYIPASGLRSPVDRRAVSLPDLIAASGADCVRVLSLAPAFACLRLAQQDARYSRGIPMRLKYSNVES